MGNRSLRKIELQNHTDEDRYLIFCAGEYILPNAYKYSIPPRSTKIVDIDELTYLIFYVYNHDKPYFNFYFDLSPIKEQKCEQRNILFCLDKTQYQWKLIMTEFRKKLCLTNESSQILTVLHKNSSENVFPNSFRTFASFEDISTCLGKNFGIRTATYDSEKFEYRGRLQGEIDNLVFECKDDYSTSTVSVTVTEKSSR